MSLIKRKTVEIGSAQVTVRSSDGWTETDRLAVARDLYAALGKLSEDGTRYIVGSRLAKRIEVLSTLIVNTEAVQGELGFVWPGEAANAAELVATHEGIAELPADAIDRWAQAIIDVDAPPEPELAPVEGDEGKSSGLTS